MLSPQTVNFIIDNWIAVLIGLYFFILLFNSVILLINGRLIAQIKTANFLKSFLIIFLTTHTMGIFVLLTIFIALSYAKPIIAYTGNALIFMIMLNLFAYIFWKSTFLKTLLGTSFYTLSLILGLIYINKVMANIDQTIAQFQNPNGINMAYFGSVGDYSGSRSDKTFATAGSILPPQLHYYYLPQFVLDNDPGTWWSPVNPYDGKTNWIKINFPEEKVVRGIVIHNGAHYPDYPEYGNLFFANSRVTKAIIRFSDGSSQTIRMADTDKNQTIYVNPVLTSYILFQPVAMVKGTRWADICISTLIPITD